MKINKILDNMIYNFNEPINDNNINDDRICCDCPLGLDEDVYICRKCHKIYPIITDGLQIYTPRVIKQNYSTNRHFRNILYQLQGKETFHLKDLNKIKNYIKENEISDYSTENIRLILKKLNLTGYYLHIQLIRKHLGEEMLIIDDKLQRILERKFILVEQAIIRKNKNLPSYHLILKFILHHLQIYKYDHLLKNLKNENKYIKLFENIKL